jgi:hypothetical protein
VYPGNTGIVCNEIDMIGPTNQPAAYSPFSSALAGLSSSVAGRFAHYVRTLCHEPMARQVNVGQRQRRQGATRILRQAALTHLRKAPQALDHREHMLDPSTNSRLVAVLRALDLVGRLVLAAAHPLVRKVLCLRRFRVDQFLLASIGIVAVHPLLIAMQQARQRMILYSLRLGNNPQIQPDYYNKSDDSQSVLLFLSDLQKRQS